MLASSAADGFDPVPECGRIRGGIQNGPPPALPPAQGTPPAFQASLSVSDTTIVGNTANGTNPTQTQTVTWSGGGLSNRGQLLIYSTIVANNVLTTAGGTGPDIGSANTGVITLQGDSDVIQNGSGWTGLTDGFNGNVIGHNPLLGTFGLYGGTTETIPCPVWQPRHRRRRRHCSTCCQNAIDGTTQTINVDNPQVITSTAIMPAAGNYFIQVGQTTPEQMLVTGLSTTSVGLTVMRGQNGTTGVGHMYARDYDIFLAFDQTGAARIPGPGRERCHQRIPWSTLRLRCRPFVLTLHRHSPAARRLPSLSRPPTIRQRIIPQSNNILTRK